MLDGVLLLFSSSITGGAATLDQVALVGAKMGAGYVNTVSNPLRVKEPTSAFAKVMTSLSGGNNKNILK